MRYKKIKVAGVTHSLHKYVWEQVHGPVPDGMVVHHINHDKLDNRIENLQLMTHAEHSAHHNRVHPTEKECAVCMEFYEPPANHRGRSQVCSWECRSELLSRQRIANNGARKLNREQTIEIAARLAAGEMGKHLAEEYGVSRPTISRIKKAGPNAG